MRTGQLVIVLKKAAADKMERKLLPIEGTVVSIERGNATVMTRRGLFQCSKSAIKKIKPKHPKTLVAAKEAFFNTPSGRELLSLCNGDVMQRNRITAAFEAGWKLAKNSK